MLELPAYHWPNLRNLLLGLWERARIFLGRVGTIILALMVMLWFLACFPAPPPGATGPADPVQHCRHARPRPRVDLRAHRLQLADLDRAGARTRRARSRGRRARHRVCDVQRVEMSRCTGARDRA